MPTEPRIPYRPEPDHDALDTSIPALRTVRRHPRRVAMEGALSRVGHAAEVGFVVLSLFLFSRALVPLLLEVSGSEIDLGEGNPVLRGIFVAIHAVSLILVATRWRSILRTAARHPATLLLVGLAVASVAWSADPALTLRRSAALVGTTAFGVYLADRFELRTLVRLVAATLGLVAAASVVFALVLPEYGVDHSRHAGDWKGVYTQKNELGQAMVAGAVAFAVLLSSGYRRYAAWTGLGLSIALVLLSGSKTALAVLAACAVAAALVRAFRWTAARAVPYLSLAGPSLVLAGAAVFVFRESLLGSLGRDATLTGRTPLWSAVLESISRHPLLGHGYSAYWVGWDGPSAAVWAAVRWETPHAHNGYLDLALDLGWMGLALFLAGAVVALWRSAHAVRATGDPEAFWLPVFLVFVLLYNLSESVILRQNSIFWVLYVATVLSATRVARSEQVPRERPARPPSRRWLAGPGPLAGVSGGVAKP